MSLDQAAQIGTMGNVALITGGVGAVGGAATAAAAYGWFGVMPAAGRTAFGLMKGIADDVIPPPGFCPKP